jgi:hypothetical protein
MKSKQYPKDEFRRAVNILEKTLVKDIPEDTEKLESALLTFAAACISFASHIHWVEANDKGEEFDVEAKFYELRDTVLLPQRYV